MAINAVNKSKLRTFWGWEVHPTAFSPMGGLMPTQEKKNKKKTENLNNVINISCEFHLQKLLDMYILHKFSCGHNEAAKISSNMKRIAYISSFTPCKS